MGITEESEQRV